MKLKFTPRHGAPSDADTARVFFERMEPRVLFSADALAGLVATDPFTDNDGANATMNVGTSAGYLVDLYTRDNSSPDSLAPTDAERASQFNALRTAFDADDTANESADSLDSLGTLFDGAESGAETRQEIIFVDAATPDYQQLLAGINTDTPGTDYQIFILQSDRDGIEQISEILGGFNGVDAIHLVSHGDETGLQLGNGWLGQASLDEHGESIATWSAALAEDADLLIYGCNLAADVSGQQLVGSLAELTGADVAASDDLTGAAAMGGDWQFEYNTGDIESGVAITTTAQQTWSNVLATINVTITGDIVDAFDGQTSLREAITLANGLAGLDEIVLGAGTYTLSIAGNDNNNDFGDLDIRDHLIIRGGGAASTIIDGNSAVISDRVFETVNNSQATQLSISDLTITNGDAQNQDGGALFVGKDDIVTLTDVVISNNQAKEGAGIGVDDDASLDLTRVTFSNNVADDYGGAISVNTTAGVTGSDVSFESNSAIADNGGAISNFGNVSLDRALFFNNSAVNGGAIHNEGGTVKLTNATLSSNSASSTGGAINNQEDASSAPGTLSITNSTLTGNTSAGINGIFQLGTSSISLLNSILNDSGSNLSGGLRTSIEYNIDSDNSAGLGGGTNMVGNPMLDVLADNGGYTQTHALLSGSIAINAGTSTLAPNADQREQIRIGATDIGAYEFTDYGLIWGDVGTDTISVATLDGNHVTDLITGLDDPTSVAIDPDGGKVYWANEGDGRIQRANLDGTNVEDVITGLSGPVAIDLYLAGGKIYWTDGSGTLLRANLDGSAQEVISGSPNAPTGVAVDGPGGMVYWVDDGANLIKETSLTGTGTGNLVTSNVANTADLELDLVNDKIYWTNTSTGHLWRANLSDGSGAISANVGGTPYGLALDPVGNKTYWMDSGAGELYRVDLSTGANRITLYDGLDGLVDPRDVDFFTMTGLIKPPANNPPTATNLDSTSVYNEGDASVAITDIVVSDADVGEIIKLSLSLNDPSSGSLSANDGATYSAVTGEWALTDTVANVNTALANLVFNPTASNDQDTSISVTIDDGDEDTSGALTGTITLDVTPSIGGAVNTLVPGAQNTTEDTTLVFSTGGGNAITVDDETIDDTLLRTTLTVTNGTLNLATTAGLTSVTGDGTDTIIVIGAESDINTALDGLTYTPTNNYSGPANLTVTTDLQADLLGFYEFEINGDIGDDTSPNGTNDGAVVGATQIIDGTRGNVLHLDGNDVITIPGTFGDPQSITLAAWVQLDAASGGSEVISLGDRVILRLDETFSGLGVFGSFYDGSSYLTTSSNTFIAGTGWHHVAYTLDGTANEQTLYIDGLAVDTTTHATAVVYTAGGDSTLGRNASSASYFFEGEMDDARIYDRALGTAEIEALANNQFSDTETVSITVDPANDAPYIPIPSGVFINELHYDNVGIDSGEAIELMGPAGTDLTGWSLVLYNGNVVNTVYDTVALSGTIADQSNGYGTLAFNFPVNGIQNGGSDGIALVNASSVVVQFISYEGTLTAADGPATGLTSTDIGVAESGTTPVGDSLQLTDTGWTTESTNTFGLLNTGQSVYGVDSGFEDTDNVYTHAQMLNLLGATDVDDIDANLTIDITNVVNGTLVMSFGTGGIGTIFTFTPDPEFSGQLTFDYQVLDDDLAASSIGNGIIDIAATNDAPSATNLSSTSAYNEGDASVPITDIVVSDVDTAEVISATLTLADTATGSLSANDGASYTAGTGIWTITDTVANVNTALANLVFNPNLNNDVSTTISVDIDDGDEDLSGALTGTIDLDVTPVNDAPTATNLSSTSAYNEGDASVAITDIVVSDVDTAEVISATLTLADTTTGSLSANDGASYDGLTGIWTITDTVANVNTALANLVFNPTFNNDVDTSITVSIDDGDEDASGALTGTIDLDVTPVNDAPTATNLSSTSFYNEGDASVAITDIVVSDVDTAEIISATLTLIDTTTGSLSANDGASYDGLTGIWTITDTVANVNTALANLVFNPNLNNDVSTTISVDIDDGDEDASGALTGSIVLNASGVNDAPTATNLSTTSAYNEGDASVAITDIVVSDIDTGEIISATLTLANTATGSLSANDGATYDGLTGIWTITDTVANVNTALANLVFNPNLNNDVNTTISVDIDDGDEDLSGALTGTIDLDVTPVNDAPTATNLSSTSAYNEGDASVAITDIVVSDADTAEVISASLTLADTSTGSLSANDGASYDGLTGIWTITDTVANVNTALANLVFNPTATNDVDTSIAVSIDDGDEDASGALTGTVALDVTPVNDAPTATNLSSTSAYNEGDASVAITDIVVSDVDTAEVISATLTLADTATGSLSANDGASYDGLTGIWTITDTVTNVNTALANLVFNPTLNNDLDTSIAVSIDDGDEDASGALTGTIDLDVTPVNDAPTATNLSSTSAYNEGDASVAITDIVISDVDTAEVITATLTLADTATGSLSANDGASYDGLTGIWSITGSVAQVNTALANLVFNPTAANDVDTSIAVSIDDGDEDASGALTGTIDLDVTPINDAPTATNLSSTSFYNEGDASVPITDIVVSDVDTAEVISATLTLADTATGSLSANDGASYDGLTGIWSITGSVTQVNTALANLVFNPTLNNDVDTSITVSIDDGDEDASGALSGTIDLDVTPVNDAPAATNLVSGSTYNQGDASLALNDIVITDVDAGESVTATLTLANTASGSLSANDGASYSATTGVWTITGTVAQVNTALANLEFIPLASNTLDTAIAISIDDGDEDSSGPLIGAMTITVNPLPVIEPPVVEPPPDDPIDPLDEPEETEPPVEETEPEIPASDPLPAPEVETVLPAPSSAPTPSLVVTSTVNIDDPSDRVDNRDNDREENRETTAAKPAGVDSLLIKLREQVEFFNDPLQLIGADSFITRLNDMRDELISETEDTEKVVGSSLTVTAGLSVGYVVWLARSGVLLSSVLSSLPAWRFIDPLPVLAGLQGGKADDDEESLESMVEEKPVDDASQDAAGDDKSDA